MTCTSPTFEPYEVSHLDSVWIPLYNRFQLAFQIEKPVEAVSKLQAGVVRLITALPFLSGQINLRQSSTGGKEMFEVQPNQCFDLSQMVKVKHHDDLLRCALHKAANALNKPEQAAPPHEPLMPLSPFPDPLMPQQILGLQVNVYVDGLILSIAAHHCCFDGTGVGAIIEHFAACCRNPVGARLCTSPEMEAEVRKTLSQMQNNITDCGKFPLYQHVTSRIAYHTALRSGMQGYATDVATQSFTISGSALSALKERCNRLLPHVLTQSNDRGLADRASSASDQKDWVSSNDVLVALVWLCISHARFPELKYRDPGTTTMPASSVTTLGLPVNIRHRASPPLPRLYLGNAACVLEDTIPVQWFGLSSELDQDQWISVLCRVAHRIRTKLRKVTGGYIQDFISYCSNPSTYISVTPGKQDFILSSLRDIGVYESDFGDGIGRPLRMRLPDSYVDGLVYVMPKRPNEEGKPWELNISLKNETMENILNDHLFLRFFEPDNFWNGA